jgi:hypothetical protein
MLRHDLGDVGIDRDQLDADADAGEQPAQIDAEGGRLEREQRRRGAISQEGPYEDPAATEPVCDG